MLDAPETSKNIFQLFRVFSYKYMIKCNNVETCSNKCSILVYYCNSFIEFYIISCSNAVKFTHEGKVKINLYVITDPCPEDQQKLKINTDEPLLTARSRVLLDEKKDNGLQSHETVVWIRCDVQDTGIGIPGTFLCS